MIKVLICEDEKMTLAYIKKCASGYIEAENLAIEIVCASQSPYEILEYVKENKTSSNMYMYFLDIDLAADINGIALADEIRRFDHWGLIVFITSSADSYISTFKHQINVFDYIVKDCEDIDARIAHCLNKANERYLNFSAPGRKRFSFKTANDIRRDGSQAKLEKGSMTSINHDEILYFETSAVKDHVIVLHTDDCRYELRDSLKNIINKLGHSSFHKCKRDLLINLKRVKDISNENLLCFDNDYDIDIPAKYIKALKKAFDAYTSN